MSNLNESLATILAAMPQRLVLSKQTNKTQTYRKVTVEKYKRTAAAITRSPNIHKNRCSTRTVPQSSLRTIYSRRWEHSFYS